jgi:pimeloyl-ACP methyl ester carboxylesterase
VQRFESFDGTRIAYADLGASSPLPAVVLLHGLGVDANVNWMLPGIAGALADAGRRVVAVDARGHGESDKPREAERYGEARMALDVRRLLDELDLGDADLVGYSMGAIVALLTAVDDPRIRRLVVAGVGASVVELGGVDTRAMASETLAAALRATDPSTIEHALAAQFRAAADAVGADREALAAQATSTHAGPIPLERITIPTLVIAGNADELASRPEVIAAALPEARAVRIDGDHASALFNPGFAPLVLEFLAADRAPGGLPGV